MKITIIAVLILSRSEDDFPEVRRYNIKTGRLVYLSPTFDHGAFSLH